MSGGVDSSMALLLLKRQGWEPVGVTLILPHWEGARTKENACCTKEALETAESVCRRLGVEHHALDAREDFREKVIEPFVSGLSSGITPNPCAYCNRDLKFSKLLEFAQARGIGFIATGHYARTRINPETGKTGLLRPKDLGKDQTYGMCLVSGETFARVVFPLGDLLKSEVYSLAEREGFPVFSKKKQSQDLCFVSGTDLPGFMQEKLGKNPGPVRDGEGKVLGRHRGLHFYTVGQRRGLGLTGQYYVKSLDPGTNTLVVAKEKSGAGTESAVLRDCNFVSGIPPENGFKVLAQVRSHQAPVEAVVGQPGKGGIEVRFKAPVEAVTPGQVCALYSGDACLGGGVIARA